MRRAAAVLGRVFTAGVAVLFAFPAGLWMADLIAYPRPWPGPIGYAVVAVVAAGICLAAELLYEVRTNKGGR